MPSVGLKIGRHDAGGPPTRLVTDVLDAIERELRRRKVRLGVGIDEFQRLHEWGGEAAERALKGTIERHEHISYVMAGSAKSLIAGMVTRKKRALWKVVDTLYADTELLVPLGRGAYLFDDPFFRRWVQLHALPDIGIPAPALTNGKR